MIPLEWFLVLKIRNAHALWFFIWSILYIHALNTIHFLKDDFIVLCIHEVHAYTVYLYTVGTNACTSGKGGCSHICIPGPNNIRKCACPDGLSLQPGGLNCGTGKFSHSHNSRISLLKNGSFNLCQLFENQVVKVSKKGWHSLKYCVNMVIICVNMVILCINKRLTNI